MWQRIARTTALIGLLAAPSMGQQVGGGLLAGGSTLVSAPVSPITNGQTKYLSLDGSDVSGDSTEVQTQLDGGTLKRLRCYTSIAPGAGETVTLTIQTGVCGTALSNSTLVCTVSGTAQTADDLTNAVAVTAGQCGVIKVDYSVGAATSFPRAWLRVF